MNYLNQQGHLTDEGIALYVDALKLDKTSGLPKAVFHHIDKCNSCHAQAIELYAAVGVIDYADIGAHPTLKPESELPDPGKRNWIWGALGLLITLLVVWLAYQFIYNDRAEKANSTREPSVVFPANPDEVPVDTLKSYPGKQENPGKRGFFEKEKDTRDQPSEEPQQEEEPELIAMDFEPYEPLENQVGEVFRSDEIGIVGPVDASTFTLGETVSLEWKGAEEKMSVKVMDNKNNLILLRNNALSPYLIGDLKPGLYYWKLETEDDLIHVGKFFVNGTQ